MERSRTFSGVDKTVIESLPFFRFSSLKGSKQGLECSVCLSKFEDVEILRLLPKCKHAFHINCIDQWLEKHSSCPLCRHKVNADDSSLFVYSTSMRFLNQSDFGEDSNIELYVQREEEDQRHGSSRFSIGSSFRKITKGNFDKEEASLIQQEADNQQVLHKFNHKIMVSDHVVFKNRWSSVSSSDLMCLNSEMINGMSSDRFSWNIEQDEVSTRSRTAENEEIAKIKEEIERKRLFENKVGSSCSSLINKTNSTSDSLIITSRIINPSDRRSVSEITAVSRHANRINDSDETNQKQERIRRLWLPIARRTIQWFANRETRSQQTTHHIDV
ncbi:E3 ubiquitin-protein ligase ATL42 [Carica papaya]|uniref:E3 ubiquitin-protein ligase ATL42 n=1 Tax=Carica papaya TaxID=3649 RepID=UPI000B8CB835|nr:E3 ubiquitin-protein ligase ATL42 [Carica papaya]